MTDFDLGIVHEDAPDLQLRGGDDDAPGQKKDVITADEGLRGREAHH